ncbi:MAG TPA: methyltransferase domain-containing protein [Chthoniobacterales bacterium]|jgi:SAM-dependent methyltransferase|nr:methyltransferase domain-containing protein [Chthoniobacterales bacterium]
MKQTQTDWDALYERRETPWEKGQPHPALVDFLAEIGPLAGGILVPGCGSGHDVRALSTTANHVVGIDIAPRAIAKASSRPRVANEEYALADLFNLAASFNQQFDWIFEHTCFCAIDPGRREEYVRTIVRLLKPTGRMLAIFFINPDHDEEGPPYRVSTAELGEFFGKHFALEREWVPARTHPGREERELMRVLVRSS